MDITALLALINALLGLAFKVYESISQIKGDTPIPEWSELTDRNKLLQAKIDAEKG